MAGYTPTKLDIDRFGCPEEHFNRLVERASDFIVVFGHARSGTTIVADWLNTDAGTLVYYEDSPFWEAYRTDYRDWYNAFQVSTGLGDVKGYFMPSFGLRTGRWSDYYLKTLEQFPRAGTKIAIGPHGYILGLESRIMDFVTSIFGRSLYFLTTRGPWQTIRSALSVLTTFSTFDIIYSYIKSAVVSQRLALTMARVVHVEHSSLCVDSLRTIIRQEAPDMKCADGFVLEGDPPKAAADEQLSGSMVVADLCRIGASRASLSELDVALTAMHRHLVSTFNANTGRVAHEVHRAKHMLTMRALEERALAALEAAEESFMGPSTVYARRMELSDVDVDAGVERLQHKVVAAFGRG